VAIHPPRPPQGPGDILRHSAALRERSPVLIERSCSLGRQHEALMDHWGSIARGPRADGAGPPCAPSISPALGPDRESPLFTMTIHNAGRAVLARGRSRDGEEWEQALLRLYQDSLSDDAPARRLVFATRRTRQSGGAANAVILEHRDEAGHAVSEPLFIHTDPPQF
jgi:hypothetical protein